MFSATITCEMCHRVLLTTKHSVRKVREANPPAPGQGEYEIQCPHCPAVYDVTVKIRRREPPSPTS